MYLHIERSRPLGLFGRRYCLDARLHVSPAERRTLVRHRLLAFEIFHDPVRDDFIKQAAGARERVKALPWFPDTDQMASVYAREWLETFRIIRLARRVRRSFRVTVQDLVEGISITHHSINQIREIEAVIAGSVEAIERTLAAALAYEGTETLIAPKGDDDDTIPPEKWPASWRRK